MPKSWNDIKLNQYQELKDLEKEQENFGNYEYLVEQLSILMDTDSEYFDDMSIDELIDLIKQLKWLYSKPATNIKQVIEIDNVKYYCKELNNLSLGEFLDLEHYFKDDMYLNLHIIAAILYRRRKIDEWDNSIDEPYIYNPIDKADMYLNLSITHTFGLIDYYINWKENINKIYENQFEQKNDDEDIDEDDELTGQELAQQKKLDAEDKIKNEWSWEATIYNLSNKDITKYNKLFNTSFILIMNTLAMKSLFEI